VLQSGILIIISVLPVQREGPLLHSQICVYLLSVSNRGESSAEIQLCRGKKNSLVSIHSYLRMNFLQLCCDLTYIVGTARWI